MKNAVIYPRLVRQDKMNSLLKAKFAFVRSMRKATVIQSSIFTPKRLEREQTTAVQNFSV